MTGYIEVGGLRTWHQVSGEGDPLVLLHGRFVGASSFFAQVPALVEAGYRVHVPERRGQAHTPDVEGPLSYSVMADDTVADLEQELGAPGHLVGWSDGAVVALLVARRRPDLVARMVLIGQYYNSAGRVAGGAQRRQHGRDGARAMSHIGALCLADPGTRGASGFGGPREPGCLSPHEVMRANRRARRSENPRRRRCSPLQWAR